MNEEKPRESIFELLKRLDDYGKAMMQPKQQYTRTQYPVLNREEVIDHDDILNLQIALNTSQSLEQFLANT
jgi:hypothetical protein